MRCETNEAGHGYYMVDLFRVFHLRTFVTGLTKLLSWLENISNYSFSFLLVF